MRINLKPKPKVTGRLTEYSLFFSKLFTVSVHKISNTGMFIPDPHDHPSNFLSIGLRGWYLERLFDDPTKLNESRVVVRRFAHYMSKNKAHYIFDGSDHAWTLFITWGYRGRGSLIYTPDGPMTGRQYYAEGYFKQRI